MISATCESNLFWNVHIVLILKIAKLWNKLFRLVYIHPGPFCGSTYLVIIIWWLVIIIIKNAYENNLLCLIKETKLFKITLKFGYFCQVLQKCQMYNIDYYNDNIIISIMQIIRRRIKRRILCPTYITYYCYIKC